MNRKYWFVRKPYGWGWRPARWQGWFVLGLYFGGLASIIVNLDVDSYSASDTLINFFLPAVGQTVVLFVIIWIKGEVPPKWQWGKNKNDERENS